MTGPLATAASLWRTLRHGDRRRLSFLALLTLVAALAELATFAALGRFLSRLVAASGPPPWRDALLFALAALVASLVRMLLTEAGYRVGSRISHELSVEAQRRLVHQPLAFHVEHGGVEAVAMLDKVGRPTFAVFLPLVQLFAAVTVGGALFAALLVTTPLVALAVLGGVLLFYLLVAGLSWRRLRGLSIGLGGGYEERVRTVQETNAGIRDVILDSLQEQRTARFAEVDFALQRQLVSAQALSGRPRFLAEGVGIAALAVLVVLLADAGLGQAIPRLGLIAFAAQRLLPLAQGGYSGWSALVANAELVAEVQRTLALPIPPPAAPARPMAFERSVSLERVGFAYPGRPSPVLLDVSLELRKGSRTGIAGPTGCGKSTLADLVMGLIAPTAGGLAVDGVAIDRSNAAAWQRNIAHVGQHLFLADASLADNIAFGDPQPDARRIADAARAACLDELLAGLPQGLATRIGEGGARLSGGQRQRLALARAFYKRAPLLVLDEATSALDEATEARLLAGLDPAQTLLLISHRPAVLALCDRLFELVDGRLVQRRPLPSAAG